MAHLIMRDVRKSYGATQVIHGVDLDIRSGEFIVFVGPSGCGKSTLLRMIAGLEDISGGTMTLDGTPMNDIAPARRGVAMVFQSYALYPHMTVADNMSFGLRVAGLPKAEITDRVGRAARMLQIEPLLSRKPRHLSGGQRQRVAIGRAITRDPKLFLFDEPLSNLDAALRVATRIEIARLKEAMPDTTMIYVTHDQVEAMTLSDRIVVMNGGRIEQVGTPMELYHRPANRFVAGFIGSPAMNFVDPAALAPSARAKGLRDGLDPGVTLGIRPEDLVEVAQDGLIEGQVTMVERLGEVTLVHLTLALGASVLAKLPGDAAPARGAILRLDAPQTRIHRFGPDGMALS